MIKLTRVYPSYYGSDTKEPMYVDENSIISIGTNRVRCGTLAGYCPYTEITLVTGDKYFVNESVESVNKKINNGKEEV